MYLLKPFLSAILATGVLLTFGVFALAETPEKLPPGVVVPVQVIEKSYSNAAYPTAEKPWDDAVYYVESPDILTVEFARPIRYFANRDEVLREKMSVHLIAFDVSSTIVCSRDFPIGPGGVIDLRELLDRKTARYVVGDLTISEAEELLQSQFPATQRVILSIVVDLVRYSGNKLVEPDGYITLGDENGTTRVYVHGLTIKEINEAVEKAFPKCEKGSISVSIFAYNSKEYYVIDHWPNRADQVYTFPCTGKETIRSAFESFQGLALLEGRHLWIARPVGDRPLMIPVDLQAVLGGYQEANHRIYPGDRIFIGPAKQESYATTPPPLGPSPQR